MSIGRDKQTNTRKYHNKTVHGSMRDAQLYLSRKLQERQIGQLPQAAGMHLDDFLDQWLTTVARPRLRPRTYDGYESALRLYIRPTFGTRPVGSITQFDLQSLYAQLLQKGLSERTIAGAATILQSAMGQAVRCKLLIENPCIGIQLPRQRRNEIKALSVEECKRFLEAARQTDWYALFALALTTGMRPSEYAALRWGDVDWARGTASVSRTIQLTKEGWRFDDTKRERSRRLVKLQSFVLDALKAIRSDNNLSLIFCKPDGLPIRQSLVKKRFHRVLDAAGLPRIRLYDLRHTAATLGFAAGVSVKAISKQLGHASTAFTLDRYSHVLPSIQDEAAARVERLLAG